MQVEFGGAKPQATKVVKVVGPRKALNPVFNCGNELFFNYVYQYIIMNILM